MAVAHLILVRRMDIMRAATIALVIGYALVAPCWFFGVMFAYRIIPIENFGPLFMALICWYGHCAGLALWSLAAVFATCVLIWRSSARSFYGYTVGLISLVSASAGWAAIYYFAFHHG